MVEEKKELKRGLESRHLQLIALGGIIGSGYFLGTGYVIEKAGPGSFIAYLLGGLIVLCVMYCLGELAVSSPVSSSFIQYASEYISPSWACGVGWSYWVTWVSYVPSEMIAAGIIMSNFFPIFSPVIWAILFGIFVTLVNIVNVNAFGELEFWFSIIKVLAILLFICLAVLAFLGYSGKQVFVGTSVLLGKGGLFPKGVWAIFLTMVIILVNFQGSEIIGLAAGESKDPQKTIPIAIRNVTWRIIALYVIPVFLLVCIFPWNEISLDGSVFAEALSHYGFHWASGIFSFVVLTAAISCSSSGLYGCTRALYALSAQGMAPSYFARLSNNNVPKNATFFSLVGCWLGILFYTIMGEGIYKNLLALSGFSGAIAWISICWSQLKFRRSLEKTPNGVKDLKFKIPFFPYITHFAIWVQVACLVVMWFNEDLRIAFYIGLPLLVIPIVWYYLRRKRIKDATIQN
ncbi:MAG TPA: amino acid permease [Leptospiraceae bacterium]|nr:amino acid permease [Leptospiraceae bacterium]HMW06508.1 amino acid permease [Leptospiraceae bacterium]HMX33249.1 amino acid permease [Leptospiraceae bacterium]HMY32854.1 amino acid permease [Leptospiraceae bacterium]HMZ66095.1 amino acid permease [Leptospiraceae bacterium]